MVTSPHRVEGARVNKYRPPRVSDPATATIAREMEAAWRRAALELGAQRSPCFRRGIRPVPEWPKECNPRRLVTRRHARIPVTAASSHPVPDRTGVDRGREREREREGQRRQRNPSPVSFTATSLNKKRNTRETIPLVALSPRAATNKQRDVLSYHACKHSRPLARIYSAHQSASIDRIDRTLISHMLDQLPHALLWIICFRCLVSATGRAYICHLEPGQ
ncbi:hypothetical protein LZ30DRAFT_412181 [Colletotrichum cereale]|nr:hypothetical protein LZ30DRAFT_412181 [Colletotrichum cereale]